MKKRTSAGWTAKTHPKPNESPLWPHLELIRTMRLGRHTWAQIAEAIQKAGGPKVAFNTVYNFYKRAAERAKKGKGLRPLGFEDPFASLNRPSPTPARTAPPTPKPAAPDAPPQTFKEKLLAKKPEPKPNVFGPNKP